MMLQFIKRIKKMWGGIVGDLVIGMLALITYGGNIKYRTLGKQPQFSRNYKTYNLRSVHNHFD